MPWPDLLFDWMIVTPSGMVFMHAYGVFLAWRNGRRCWADWVFVPIVCLVVGGIYLAPVLVYLDTLQSHGFRGDTGIWVVLALSCSNYFFGMLVLNFHLKRIAGRDKIKPA